MATTYFNKIEFKQALSFAETNPLLAKIKFEEYLKKYPKDYSSYTYYASILITLGEFTKAEYVLDSMEYLSKNDKQYAQKQDKIRLNTINSIGSRLRLLSYQEKFEELYQFYQENSKEIDQMAMAPLIFYCKKKLGMIEIDIRENYPYIFRQIASYKESDFLNHIERHLSDSTYNQEEINPSIFKPNFPIQTIINEIKKYIPASTCLYLNYYVDVYIFKYDECGRDNNKTVDYFKVICFHNTSDIITIYPSRDCQALPHIDLNYLIKDDARPKVKQLSQIDKFNKRYGIK